MVLTKAFFIVIAKIRNLKPLLTTTFKETFAPLFFTFDNKNLYVSSNIGRDKASIVEYDIANKKEVKVLYENPDYDVTGLNYSRKEKYLNLQTIQVGNRNIIFLIKRQKIFTMI